MDCFHDFCLFCDRDSPDGAYCSQQCKLADLERSNSNPSSPSSPVSRQSWNYPPTQRHDAYHQRQSSTPGYHAPTASASSRPRSSYFMWDPSQQHSSERAATNERQLTPSSSRTSLSSTTSLTSGGGITNTQAKQLAEYFGSFDAAKAAKRRSSVR